MRKWLVALSSLMLFACAAKEKNAESLEDREQVEESSEEIADTFMLKADRSYLFSGDNEEEVGVYVIEGPKNRVYVQVEEEPYSEEDLAKMAEMTEEELDEFIGPEVEEPIYELKHLEMSQEKIVLEYEDKIVELTALSDSVFENESGVRYELEENVSIAEYEDRLFED